MIALGSDHAGFPLKEEIKAYLEEKGIAYRDVGAYDTSSVDYPYQAKKACDLVVSGECEKEILCCGTGIGISMTAHMIRGIRGLFQREVYPPAQRRERAVSRRARHRRRRGAGAGGRVPEHPVRGRTASAQGGSARRIGSTFIENPLAKGKKL